MVWLNLTKAQVGVTWRTFFAKVWYLKHFKNLTLLICIYTAQMSAIQVKINKQVRHCVMVSLKKNNTFCLQRHLHAIKKKILTALPHQQKRKHIKGFNFYIFQTVLPNV